GSRPREHPGDGDLRNRSPDGSGDCAQLFDQGQIAIQIRALKARRTGVELAFGTVFLPVPTDQTARKHSIGRDTDPELPAGREDFTFNTPRDQRVLDLQVCDRVHRLGAPDGLRADFREADVTHVSLLDQVGNRADRVLDGYVRIETRRTVDVD